MWFKRLAFIILSDKRKYIASYLHIRCIQIYFCSVYQDLLKRYFTFCFCCFVVSKGVRVGYNKRFHKICLISHWYKFIFFTWLFFIQTFKFKNSTHWVVFCFRNLVSESHNYFILMHCLKCKLKEAFFKKKNPWF